jgi:hypothetical protein
VRRRNDDRSFCPYCGNGKEDFDHAFKDYTCAKKTRFHSPLGGWLKDISLPFIPCIEQVNFQSSLKVISHALSLCYNIWFARNKFCFDGEQFHVNDIVGKVWTIT